MQKWNHDGCWREYKESDDSSSCKDDYNGMCDCECNKVFKIYEYLDITNCSCEKGLFGKLVLACEDEVLNTTETSPNDKKNV